MTVGASVSSIATTRVPNCYRWKNLISLPSLSFCNWRTSRISSLASAPSASMSTKSTASETEGVAVEPQKSKKPWLIVGLGNPGKKYQATRHNVGFEMVDAIAEAEGISISSVSFKALLGKGFIGDIPVMLAKPQTFMNASGWGYCFVLQDSVKASTCDF